MEYKKKIKKKMKETRVNEINFIKLYMMKQTYIHTQTVVS